MTMRILAAVAAFGFLTAFAPAPFPKQPRKEKAIQDDSMRMQGTWKVVEYSRPGMKAGVRITTSYTHVQIEGKQFSMQRDLNGRKVSSITYEFTIDRGTKKMDMTRDLGGFGGGGTKYYQNGIYKFEGNRLKVMLGGLYGVGGGGAKPKMPELSFDNPPSSAQIYVLERDR